MFLDFALLPRTTSRKSTIMMDLGDEDEDGTVSPFKTVLASLPEGKEEGSNGGGGGGGE
jgi:hypothetical protein